MGTTLLRAKPEVVLEPTSRIAPGRVVLPGKGTFVPQRFRLESRLPCCVNLWNYPGLWAPHVRHANNGYFIVGGALIEQFIQSLVQPYDSL